MSIPLLIANLIAISLLVFAIYLPRNGRRDLLVSFLVVNVGVVAVSGALASSAATVGLGLGLFGVLSIIRLRSEELSQREIAYYFASLSLGLIGGLGLNLTLSLGLMAMIIVVLAIGDHPRLARRTVTSQLVLDRVISDDGDLRARVSELVSGRIIEVTINKLDVVNDMTWVTVRTAQQAQNRRKGHKASRALTAESASDSNPASRTSLYHPAENPEKVAA